MNRSARIILGVFVLVAVVTLLYAGRSSHSSPPQRADQNLATTAIQQAETRTSRLDAQSEKNVTAASTATPVPQEKAIAKPQSQSAPAAGGLVAVIDPTSGQLREADATDIAAATVPAPTGLQRRALTLAAPKAAEVQTFEAAGGATGAVLGEDSMAFMVVTKTPDGKLSADCVNGKKAAEAKIRAGNRAKKKTQQEAKSEPAQKEATDEM